MPAIISSRCQYGPFLFSVADVMSNYLTTDGLKIFSLLPEAPLRPEARGICHMVNPALTSRTTCPIFTKFILLVTSSYSDHGQYIS